MLHVHIASDVQKIQSSGCPKWRCDMLFPAFYGPNVILDGPLNGLLIRQFKMYQ